MITKSSSAYPNEVSDGLTRRELFAAMAMQGLCSASDSVGEWTGHAGLGVGEMAVCLADELIEALNKGES